MACQMTTSHDPALFVFSHTPAKFHNSPRRYGLREVPMFIIFADVPPHETHAYTFPRHSYRAWLNELGTPISVQQRAMRHGDIRVTMNVYGDPVSDALREATLKVAERATSQLLTKSVS